MDSEIVESFGMGDITVDAISFTWAVDNAIRSRTPSILGAPPARSFASIVDNEIRSTTSSNLGASPARSFASIVDYEIRSTTSSNLGAFPARSFASIVDNEIRSTTSSNLGASPARSFASIVDKKIKSRIFSNLGVAPARLSQVEGFQLFTLAELVAATNNFSLDNKIGGGSFGVEYKGELVDGREVAINRGNTWSQRLVLFTSELAFFSRLRHKHLVGLVGLCEEKDERLLVSEYMKNGALYDRLHDKGSSVLNSWKMRINIALDASRGIEYLHSYAVPSIVHRDIKSSNILLDATWTASVRLFGYGLSLMSPKSMKAAGTVRYMDPEYYGPNELIAKSDVHGLGVVLLELLTGKTATFRCGEDGGTLLSVVDFAVPAILAGDLVNILDPRVRTLDVNEAEAVQLVAYTAIHCVNLEGKDRPTMADLVVKLERALAICDSSHDSISSATMLFQNDIVQPRE